MRIISTSDESWIEEVLGHLRKGLVVALPTETVYGLAASLESPAGVERIYALKGRSPEKAIPCQVHSLIRAMEAGFRFSRGALHLAERFWPGPLTLVLPRPPSCPEWFAPGSPTIAMRVPDHPAASSLLEACPSPLAVTSANRSGAPDCPNAALVLRAFADSPDLFVADGGPVPGGLASTVVDATGPAPGLLREGPLPFATILEVWHGR
jgi:L-threonylcarbamoyladenylate synthase